MAAIHEDGTGDVLDCTLQRSGGAGVCRSGELRNLFYGSH
jgi:hypothetical protein